MSRFQKKSLPITTKPKFKPIQISEPLVERVITGPIVATPIESLLETIVEQPKIELPIVESNEIVESKDIPTVESNEVPPIIAPVEVDLVPKVDELKRTELKKQKSRELFKITVEQILLNNRKKKLEWD